MAVKWKDRPDEHDYPCAADYLGLPAGKDHVEALLASLRSAPVAHNKAKDILQAARLPLVADAPHVRLDAAKPLPEYRFGVYYRSAATGTRRYRRRSPTVASGRAAATTPTKTPTFRRESPPQ
jgi:hypothetical protein